MERNVCGLNHPCPYKKEHPEYAECLYTKRSCSYLYIEDDTPLPPSKPNQYIRKRRWYEEYYK